VTPVCIRWSMRLTNVHDRARAPAYEEA
jgi:hypothetical protein